MIVVTGRLGKPVGGFLAECCAYGGSFWHCCPPAVLARGGLGGAPGQVRRVGRAAGMPGRPAAGKPGFRRNGGSNSRAWPDERIALSRHRTGARSSRRKRGLIRRFGIVFPAAVIAVVAVIGVAVGGKVLAPGSGAFSAVQAIEIVPGSHAMVALDAERTQLIAMTAAARTLTVVAKPKLASPAEVAAANPGTEPAPEPAPEPEPAGSSTSHPRRPIRTPRSPPPTT